MNEEKWMGRGWYSTGRTYSKAYKDNIQYKHTYIDHVHLHRLWNILPQGVSGHHGDVIVDPKRCVIFVEETRVLACGSVIRALVDRLGAEYERYQQTDLHLITEIIQTPELNMNISTASLCLNTVTIHNQSQYAHPKLKIIFWW